MERSLSDSVLPVDTNSSDELDSSGGDEVGSGSRTRLINAAVACAAVLIGAFASFSPIALNFSNVGIDLLYWLRDRGASVASAIGISSQPARPSHAVILAIDEETYRRPPFEGTPQVFWTPQIAKVIDSILTAGAAVVGLDIVYPTSIEAFSVNGQRPMANFDRPFLRTLLRWGKQQDRVVLGYVQHQQQPLFPHEGQLRAVGDRENARSLNALEDPDGVIRRANLSFRTGNGGSETSFAAELAGRAMKTDPATLARTPPTLNGASVPVDGDGYLVLNFDTRPGAIPIYSLADLYDCSSKENDAYFRREFADKVVLLGVVVDVEDRKFTSQRMATAPEGVGLPERCSLPVMSQLYQLGRRREQVPGVFIHATAINNLMDGTALRVPTSAVSISIVLLLATITVTSALVLAPLPSLAVVAGVSLFWGAGATWLFSIGYVLPLIQPLMAGLIAYLLVLLYRIGIGDRDQRQIRKAFGFYLPPALVSRMAETGRLPALGGETREVTILFADLEGFTKISEGVSPGDLVSWLNDYFGIMTDIVEAHGGFVDKFIGDAILAVFGAPLTDPDHALNGTLVALKMKALLDNSEISIGNGNMPRPKNRIGVNSGPVLIGNIGSSRRFNYTVIGDAVNLASRLEGVNKSYGTQVLVSEDTVRLCDGRLRFKELDTVRVVGRAAPVRLFTPLPLVTEEDIGAQEQEDPDAIDQTCRWAYAGGLAAWRAGLFPLAAQRFTVSAHHDPSAAKFAKRAQMAAASPVPRAWIGVTDLTEK